MTKKAPAATGWQPPLDPKNKQIVVEAHLVAPAPGPVQGSDRFEQPTTEECEIFLGFIFNYYYYSKKSTLTKSYYYFFVFLKVY